MAAYCEQILIFTLCASKAAAQCIVIVPVCLCVCLWVCYHDNSKLHASILTKLGLQVKVVTISSWLNFGFPLPRGRWSVAGRNFWLRLTTASAQFSCLLWALFSSFLFLFVYQSINQSTFVKCHKSRANRRHVKKKARPSGYRMLWQKVPSLKHVCLFSDRTSF